VPLLWPLCTCSVYTLIWNVHHLYIVAKLGSVSFCGVKRANSDSVHMQLLNPRTDWVKLQIHMVRIVASRPFVIWQALESRPLDTDSIRCNLHVLSQTISAPHYCTLVCLGVAMLVSEKWRNLDVFLVHVRVILIFPILLDNISFNSLRSLKQNFKRINDNLQSESCNKSFVKFVGYPTLSSFMWSHGLIFTLAVDQYLKLKATIGIGWVWPATDRRANEM